MEIAIHAHKPSTDKMDCIVVGVYEDGILSPAATLVDIACDGGLQKFLAMGDFSGQCGETQILYQLPGLASQRLMVLGLGTHGKLKDSKFR